MELIWVATLLTLAAAIVLTIRTFKLMKKYDKDYSKEGIKTALRAVIWFAYGVVGILWALLTITAILTSGIPILAFAVLVSYWLVLPLWLFLGWLAPKLEL